VPVNAACRKLYLSLTRIIRKQPNGSEDATTETSFRIFDLPDLDRITLTLIITDTETAQL